MVHHVQHFSQETAGTKGLIFTVRCFKSGFFFADFRLTRRSLTGFFLTDFKDC